MICELLFYLNENFVQVLHTKTCGFPLKNALSPSALEYRIFFQIFWVYTLVLLKYSKSNHNTKKLCDLPL